MSMLLVASASPMVILRDGSEVPKMELLFAMTAMRRLAKDKIEVVGHLFSRCKDPSYSYAPMSIKELQKYDLIDKDAKASDTVQKVVLNAVVVDGLKITIIDPRSL